MKLVKAFFVIGFLLLVQLLHAKDYGVFTAMYEDLNTVQQEMLDAEIAAYKQEISVLTPEEQKSKLSELFMKLRDGFRIYNVVRKSPDLQKRISDFDSLNTGVKIYVISYVDDAYLNNIFYRIAEAFYDTFNPDGYVKIKYKFAKAPAFSEDKPIFLPTPDIELSDAVKQKIDISLTILNATAKAYFNDQDGYELENDADLKYHVELSVQGVLDALSGTGIQITSSASGVTLVHYSEMVNPDVPKDPLLGYPAVTVKVTYSETGTIKDGDNLNIIDWAYAVVSLYKNISREEFSREYSFVYSTWVWDISQSKEVKAGQVEDYVVTYQKIREVLGSLGDGAVLFDSFNATIAEQLFKDHPKIIDYINSQKLAFSCCLNEILRIARLRADMGEELWEEYHNPSNHSNAYFFEPNGEGDYRKIFEAMYHMYKSKGLIEDIMACTTPGREPFQMTFLARKLSDFQFNRLEPNERVHILKIMAMSSMAEGRFYEFGQGEEDIAIKIFETCQEPGNDEFLRILAATGNEDNSLILLLFEKLHDIFGENNNHKFVTEIKRLLEGTSFFSELLLEAVGENDLEKRVVNWHIAKALNYRVSDNNLGATKIREAEHESGRIVYQLYKLTKNEWWSSPEALET